MKKIWKIFRRGVFCITGEQNHEMVNLSESSPRITRSKLKIQEKRETESPKLEEPPQRKTRLVGRPKRRIKTKRKTPEMNSVCATRGSTGTISLITPKPENNLPTARRSPRHLLSPRNPPPRKSPPIKTISADTPERSERFHKEIENVTECSVRILGKGSFGTIIQATYKGELVAAKIVPPQKATSLKNELNNFLLSHPNIIRTLRVIGNEGTSCGLVIMEMYTSVTLEHLTMEESYALDDQLIVRYMIDLSNALYYCHKQRVLHLDVKPQNILVNVTTNVCKLCDFGSSCLIMGEDTSKESPDYQTPQSTVVYTSPELLTGRPATDKSDVYSFGITLWQLVHREKPYVVDNKIDLQSTIYKIVKQRERPQRKQLKNEALKTLYVLCWDHEPDKRPTMKEVIKYLENIHVS